MWPAAPRGGSCAPQGWRGDPRAAAPHYHLSPDLNRASARPGRPVLRRQGPQPAVGGQSDLCAHLVGMGLCRLRPRRLLPDDRGLAARLAHAHRARAGRVGAGAVGTRRPLWDRAHPSLATAGRSICRCATANAWNRPAADARGQPPSQQPRAPQTQAGPPPRPRPARGTPRPPTRPPATPRQRPPLTPTPPPTTHPPPGAAPAAPPNAQPPQQGAPPGLGCRPLVGARAASPPNPTKAPSHNDRTHSTVIHQGEDQQIRTHVRIISVLRPLPPHRHHPKAGSAGGAFSGTRRESHGGAHARRGRPGPIPCGGFHRFGPYELDASLL